ncbi:MAG: hypothetical protein JO294_04975, partial [Alphaproteobacteria bacterium]|nr:hypothetical protein [Alphaproteobacteria bacterium]
MATTSPDDIALLKQELAQFLLAEITTADGAQTFRGEVSSEVGQVIDKILNERLAPALDNLKKETAEHARATNATLDEALAKLKAATPAESPEVDRKLADIAATLDELRARVGRFEDSVKALKSGPTATVQPIKTPVPTATAQPPFPSWALWTLLALSVVSVLGLANIYYERMMLPRAPASDTVAVFTPPKPRPVPPATTTTAPPASTPVSVPP